MRMHKGKILAAIANYSSHATSMRTTDYVSADYPGVMRRVIQSAYGYDPPVLFLQGASGNINMVNYEVMLLTNPNR